MGLYSIKEITKIVDRTEQSIYAYIRTEQDFFNEHREKHSKGGYRYDEEAIKRLKKRFGVEDGEGIGENFSKDANSPLLTAPPIDDELRQMSQEKERLSAELEEMKGKYETIQTAFKGKDGEIEHLKRENQALQANFKKANGELDDLKRENGFKSEEIQRLLLIIQQEKQEKAQIMLMLPPPRKSIGEKIKALFTRKPTQRESI